MAKKSSKTEPSEREVTAQAEKAYYRYQDWKRYVAARREPTAASRAWVRRLVERLQPY
jgi:hypothetical protein